MATPAAPTFGPIHEIVSLSVVDLRTRWGEAIELVFAPSATVLEITKHGRPYCMILSHHEYDRLTRYAGAAMRAGLAPLAAA